jgi:TatD DNase family protein
MKIIDTHSHYNMDELWANWTEQWQRAQAAGVTDSIVVGTSVETSQRSLELAALDPHLHPVVGIHPYRYIELITDQSEITEAAVTEQIEADYQRLWEITQTGTRPVVAVGETGLDYFRLDPTFHWKKILEAQRQGFIKHLELATKLDVPVIIHVRDMGPQAYTDVLDIIQAEYHGSKPFILHCVSGSVEYVERALSLGAYLGIAGNVTYKNADTIRSLVKIAPPDRLLLETDAPFLPPQPHRGKPCEPWMISLTAEFVQEELGLDPDLIYATSRQLFNLGSK